METILTWAQEVLSTTPYRWRSLTQALSSDLLLLQPASHEWSARDCLQHLVDTERLVFPVRLRALLAGQDFPAYDPSSQGRVSHSRRPPFVLAEEFIQLRQASLLELTALTPADLSRSARHAELGLVTLGEMLHEWAGHDLMHTVQAERALLQPFIRGCGPWQSYFVDHVAAGRQ